MSVCLLGCLFIITWLVCCLSFTYMPSSYLSFLSHFSLLLVSFKPRCASRPACLVRLRRCWCPPLSPPPCLSISRVLRSFLVLALDFISISTPLIAHVLQAFSSPPLLRNRVCLLHVRRAAMLL